MKTAYWVGGVTLVLAVFIAIAGVSGVGGGPTGWLEGLRSVAAAVGIGRVAEPTPAADAAPGEESSTEQADAATNTPSKAASPEASSPRNGRGESNLRVLAESLEGIAGHFVPRANRSQHGRSRNRNSFNASRSTNPQAGTVELAISGRVTDSKGNPLEGVRITLQRALVWTEATTAANGTYALDAQMPVGNATASEYMLPFVTVLADGRAIGYGTAEQERVPLVATGVNMVLHGMGVVTGIVVDASTQQPVDAFDVRIGHFWEGEQYTALPVGQGWQPVSGTGGRFSLSSYGFTRLRVEARAKGYVLGQSDVIDIVPENETTDVVIALKHGDDIMGIVIDAKTSQPIEGAHVRCLEGQVRPSMLVSDHDSITGVDGRFIIPAEQGRAITTLMAWHPSYSPGFSTNLDETQRQNVTIALAEGGTLQGTVTQGGKPLPSMSVIPKQTLAYPEPAYVSGTQTDSAGTFVLNGLPEGMYAVRFLAPNGLTYGKALALIQPGKVTEMNVDLADFARIYGVVTGADKAEDLEFYLSDIELPEEILYNAPVQSNGSFEYGMVLPGEYLVQIVQPGPPKKVFSQVYTLAPGQMLNLSVDFSTVPPVE